LLRRLSCIRMHVGQRPRPRRARRCCGRQIVLRRGLQCRGSPLVAPYKDRVAGQNVSAQRSFSTSRDGDVAARQALAHISLASPSSRRLIPGTGMHRALACDSNKFVVDGVNQFRIANAPISPERRAPTARSALLMRKRRLVSRCAKACPKAN